MKKQEFLETAKNKLNLLSVDSLIKEVVKLNNDLSEASSMIIDAALDVLMDKMKEDDFVRFCDTL